ncbi:hypothetical protein Zmor_005067 [Zophobas morio]|uniref:Uncharacterized protein n=1 Tax=Zophobas morio TaxID=2755281 RepID=A0AA38IME5_9CUCU|nr:hypothetical protein Zmor_005067 [Zophobas morio]
MVCTPDLPRPYVIGGESPWCIRRTLVISLRRRGRHTGNVSVARHRRPPPPRQSWQQCAVDGARPAATASDGVGRAQSVCDRGRVRVQPQSPAWGSRGETRLPSRDPPTFPASNWWRNGG